jgi:hypothetical protein
MEISNISPNVKKKFNFYNIKLKHYIVPKISIVTVFR